MKPGDVVAWNGDEWKVDLIDDLGVHISRHLLGTLTATRTVPADDLEVLRDRDDERVCMGSNTHPACYQPLSQCKCRGAS